MKNSDETPVCPFNQYRVVGYPLQTIFGRETLPRDGERKILPTFVPEFDIPDIPNAKIAGARLTTIDGLTSAVIDFVQDDGSPITYLMVPKAKIVDEMDAERIIARTSKQYEVAMWQEDGTARALFADMPREQIISIAELCKFKRAI